MPARLCRVVDIIIPAGLLNNGKRVFSSYGDGPNGFSVALGPNPGGPVTHYGMQYKQPASPHADDYEAMPTNTGTPPANDRAGASIPWGAGEHLTFGLAKAACAAMYVARSESALPPDHWADTLANAFGGLVEVDPE